ncbi:MULTISPECIES: hypothetical protein [Olivibacter]|jgi:chromosome segregation and condensation protein ScpB|uniref:Uncharacterized protein n=2 Tax=Olivibacter TaxID=376469 RepID=A0ABV6HQK2_9SPHI|nr:MULTISPECIES: hypothetical protein [Olivibacter]MDX3917441.1 hypothetical protein [Pseudosphingobacterium sp.]QEL03944.1 hypothetical protein FKG96_24960 [Olivibacter sp. LS-1]
MERIVIELTNQKAYRLLKELEELNLIKMMKSPVKLSSLRKKIQTPMSENKIDTQLEKLRNEWRRDT